MARIEKFEDIEAWKSARRATKLVYDAKGSCGELRSQLYIALDQNHIDDPTFNSISATLLETSKTISGFIKYLQGANLRGSKFK